MIKQFLQWVLHMSIKDLKSPILSLLVIELYFKILLILKEHGVTLNICDHVYRILLSVSVRVKLKKHFTLYVK